MILECSPPLFKVLVVPVSGIFCDSSLLCSEKGYGECSILTFCLLEEMGSEGEGKVGFQRVRNMYCPVREKNRYD